MAGTKVTLHTMLGNYANVAPLKSGAVPSDLVDYDFAEVKIANNLFKQVVRDAKYDLAELAIVTYHAGEGRRKTLRPAAGCGGGARPASHHCL